MRGFSPLWRVRGWRKVGFIGLPGLFLVCLLAFTLRDCARSKPVSIGLSRLYAHGNSFAAGQTLTAMITNNTPYELVVDDAYLHFGHVNDPANNGWHYEIITATRLSINQVTMLKLAIPGDVNEVALSLGYSRPAGKLCHKLRPLLKLFPNSQAPKLIQPWLYTHGLTDGRLHYRFEGPGISATTSDKSRDEFLPNTESK